MPGIFVKEFIYDTDLPCQPIQLQANMTYRIVSRQPVNISCADFSMNGITDEIFVVERDNRLQIERTLQSGYASEYVSIIGYPRNVLSKSVGFNQKCILNYTGGTGAGDSFLNIPSAIIKAGYKSNLTSILIDEIIIHKYISGQFGEYDSGPTNKGISSISFFDISLNKIGDIYNPVYPYYYKKSESFLCPPPLFVWKANNQNESILTSASNIYVNFAEGGYDVEFFLTIKFRCN